MSNTPTIQSHASIRHLPASDRSALVAVLRTDEAHDRLCDELSAIYASPEAGLAFDREARAYCYGLDDDLVSDALADLWIRHLEGRAPRFPFAFLRRRAMDAYRRRSVVPQFDRDPLQAVIARDFPNPRSVDELIAHLRADGQPVLAEAVRKRTMPRTAAVPVGKEAPWTLTAAERVAIYRHGDIVRRWVEETPADECDTVALLTAAWG